MIWNLIKFRIQNEFHINNRNSDFSKIKFTLTMHTWADGKQPNRSPCCDFCRVSRSSRENVDDGAHVTLAAHDADDDWRQQLSFLQCEFHRIWTLAGSFPSRGVLGGFHSHTPTCESAKMLTAQKPCLLRDSEVTWPAFYCVVEALLCSGLSNWIFQFTVA